jgi:hypothetical protein
LLGDAFAAAPSEVLGGEDQLPLVEEKSVFVSDQPREVVPERR